MNVHSYTCISSKDNIYFAHWPFCYYVFRFFKSIYVLLPFFNDIKHHCLIKRASLGKREWTLLFSEVFIAVDSIWCILDSSDTSDSSISVAVIFLRRAFDKFRGTTKKKFQLSSISTYSKYISVTITKIQCSVREKDGTNATSSWPHY